MTKRATEPWLVARFVILGGAIMITAIQGEHRTAAVLGIAQVGVHLIARLIAPPGLPLVIADAVLALSALALAPFTPLFAAVVLAPLWGILQRSRSWGMGAALTYLITVIVVASSQPPGAWLPLVVLALILVAVAWRWGGSMRLGPHAATYLLLRQIRDLPPIQDPIEVASEILEQLRENGIARARIETTNGERLASVGADWEEANRDIPLQVQGTTIATLRIPVSEGTHVRDVDQHALLLATALIFAEIRSAASAAERSRVSREMHDGIAQEIASMGYAIDDLLAHSPEEFRTELRGMRSQLTSLVSNLRLSIFELRGRDEGQRLGAAISELIERVQKTAPFTVHLRLDETAQHFPRPIEDELLRIIQEALANAVRHSQAQHVWVSAILHPPHAEVTIEDDGIGLTQGREDSFGLEVMRERATGINASLTMRERLGGGTVVYLLLNQGAIPLRSEAD